LARRCKVAAAAQGTLALPMSRADIADYLGLTIETVSRTLTGLRKEKLIHLPDKHAIQLVRPSELERAAGF
jgi:CRP/FNR family transcriptional regulator